MSVILKNSDNDIIHTFPSGMELTEEPWSKRLGTEPRAYAHGNVITADEKLSSRMISVHGIFKKTTSADMETELKLMSKTCYTKNLRLYGTQNPNEYYNVECFGFESEYLGMLTIAEVTIDFFVADGTRHYKDETPDDETVDELDHNYTIANGGDIEVFPVITFTVGAGASISKIAITNITDAGKSFEYTPASNLVETNVVEVDCQNGTVELDTGPGLSDDIAHWLGRFIRLLSGNNSITITVEIVGGAVGTNQCVFAFRKRWL